jgi:hypothetical protein
VKLNRRKGTAKVYVGTSGAGLVGLAGRSLKPKMQEVSNFSATLVVRSKGKAKSRLQETGKSKVRVKVSFTPTDAQAITRTKSITLRLAGR